jgi:hypothetical protein
MLELLPEIIEKPCPPCSIMPLENVANRKLRRKLLKEAKSIQIESQNKRKNSHMARGSLIKPINHMQALSNSKIRPSITYHTSMFQETNSEFKPSQMNKKAFKRGESKGWINLKNTQLGFQQVALSLYQ